MWKEPVEADRLGLRPAEVVAVGAMAAQVALLEQPGLLILAVAVAVILTVL